MFLSTIITALAKHQKPIDQLQVANAAYMRLSGLKTILRDPLITSAAQIHQLFENLFLQNAIDKNDIKGIFLAHTSNDIAPIEVNILADIIKKYRLKNVAFFSSSLYKCATIFKLIALSKNRLSRCSTTDKIICLTSDTAFTPLLESIPNTTVLGDAACLLLFQKNDQHHAVIDVLLESDGRFSQGIFSEED